MEGQAVIEAAVGEGNEVAHALRRFLRVQFAVDQRAVVHRDGEGRVLVDLLDAGNQRGVVHGQRRILRHLVEHVCADIALDLRARHGDEGIGLAVRVDAAQNIHGRAGLHIGHSVAARHIQQLGIRVHGGVSNGRFNRLADVDVIHLAQIADLNVRFIQNGVDKGGICVVLLVGQGFLGLGLLASLKVRLTGFQILRIAQDEVAVVGHDHVGNVAHMLKRHCARRELVAVSRAVFGHRIAAQHLLFGGAVLVIGLHALLEVRAARNRRGNRLRLGIAGQGRDIRRFTCRRFGHSRLVGSRLVGSRLIGSRFVLGRLALHAGHKDALHQAHAFRRVEDFAFIHIVVDEGIHAGIAFLLLGHLLVKRRLDLVLGHGYIRRRPLIQEIEHVVQLGAVHQGLLGITGLRHLLLHGGVQLVAGEAVGGEVAFQIFARVVQRGLHLRGQLGLLFLGQLIAVLRGVVADDGGAQLGLHRLLRDGSLQFRVVLVHAVAVLRVVSDILAEHLVVFILNFGFQHRHRAVVGGGQHVVRKRQRRFLGHGFFGRSGRFRRLGGRHCRRRFRRFGGRRFRRLGGRRFRRLSRRFFRRFGGRRFRRHSRRRFGRHGRRRFGRFGRRRFGHNRRRRRFRLFHLRAARSQRNQRNGQHQSQQTLLHQVFPPFCYANPSASVSRQARNRGIYILSRRCIRRYAGLLRHQNHVFHYTRRAAKRQSFRQIVFSASWAIHNFVTIRRADPRFRRSLQSVQIPLAWAFGRKKRPPSPRGEERPVDFNVSNSVSMPTRRVRTCFPGQSPRSSPALRAVSAARRTQ